MTLFYCDAINGEHIIFPEGESAHCVRVMRLRKGDKVHVSDGRGALYEGVIVDDNPSACVVKIGSGGNVEEQPYKLHVAIAPTKNIERIEWFLEKSTEIGITEISLILCERSERKNVRHDRLEKVVVSAAKQSLKAYLPILNDLRPFGEFVRDMSGSAERFIAHCNPDADKVHFKNVAAQNSLILIGPEGDFSPAEVVLARGNGFRSISLGDTRLRTETAAIYATSIASLLLNV